MATLTLQERTATGTPTGSIDLPILSKAFMLARGSKITDRLITTQIRHG